MSLEVQDFYFVPFLSIIFTGLTREESGNNFWTENINSKSNIKYQHNTFPKSKYHDY